MIISNFHINDIPVIPQKTNPKLLIYPDTMLALSLTSQLFQVV